MSADAGKDEAGAALLSSVTLTVAKSDSSLKLDSGALLRLIPCPTPRWPDLLAVSSDADRILFSSKVVSTSPHLGIQGIATLVIPRIRRTRMTYSCGSL